MIWKFLLRAGKFTRSFQCLLICIGCGNVITWIRTERNFSQWTDSTNNYGQGLSSLTLRLCILFRNMKCDKCVGMECLELHMLDLWTPRPDILRMKWSAFTVTLHAKDVTKLPNWSCSLFIYSIMMCMITQISAVCCTEQVFMSLRIIIIIIITHIHAFQYGLRKENWQPCVTMQGLLFCSLHWSMFWTINKFRRTWEVGGGGHAVGLWPGDNRVTGSFPQSFDADSGLAPKVTILSLVSFLFHHWLVTLQFGVCSQCYSKLR